MAKTSMIEREKKRARTVAKYAAKRAALKAILQDPKASDEEKWAAQIRFQKLPRNASPSRRTHHTLLEIAWTALPVLILVVIAIPSFKLLYFMDRIEEPEMTIKAVGHQW